MPISELRNLFIEIETIMEAENERNWIRGIRGISNTLSPENPASADAQFADAWHTYRTMNSGAGSFSDYHIHRDDFGERVEANRRLDELRDRVWKLFVEHS